MKLRTIARSATRIAAVHDAKEQRPLGCPLIGGWLWLKVDTAEALIPGLRKAELDLILED